MFARIYVCVYICTLYMRTNRLGIYVSVCMYVYICISACMHTRFALYICLCMYVSVYLSEKKTFKNIYKNIKGNDTDMTYRYDTNMTRRYDTQIQRTRFRMHAEYHTHPRPSISCLASAADNVSHVPGSKSAVVWKRT